MGGRTILRYKLCISATCYPGGSKEMNSPRDGPEELLTEAHRRAQLVLWLLVAGPPWITAQGQEEPPLPESALEGGPVAASVRSGSGRTRA